MTGDALREPAAIRDMFARIRGRYDLLNRLLSLGSDVRWRRRVARRVASKRPRRILDLATGSGDVWLELRHAVPHAEIICGAEAGDDDEKAGSGLEVEEAHLRRKP